MKTFLFLTFLSASLLSAQENATLADQPLRRVVEEFKAAPIVDSGLWPNLQILENGDIILTAFNKPHHGWVPGDVDAWKSSDGGETWKNLGAIAKRPDEQSNRMNHVIGYLKKEQQLMAVSSGYINNGTQNQWDLALPVTVISTDQGATWEQIGELVVELDPPERVIPFGNLIEASDGTLRFSAYHSATAEGEARDPSSSYMIISRDKGKSWNVHSRIQPETNETVIFEVAPKEWIAISRMTNVNEEGRGQQMRQSRSLDDGKTWSDEGVITKALHHPANLIRLNNGDLLLTYSDRIGCRILAHTSSDKGKNWDAPMLVYASWIGDGGYPSSVQRTDGKIVTAFYAHRSPLIDINKVQYHTGVVIWDQP